MVDKKLHERVESLELQFYPNLVDKILSCDEENRIRPHIQVNVDMVTGEVWGDFCVTENEWREYRNDSDIIKVGDYDAEWAEALVESAEDSDAVDIICREIERQTKERIYLKLLERQAYARGKLDFSVGGAEIPDF